MLKKLVLVFLLTTHIVACVPGIHSSGPAIAKAQLLTNVFITPDGSYLPLKSWNTPLPETKSVIIAVHGFNDYSNFFQQAGTYFSQHQTQSYAYDQRGFGGSANRGLWAGINTYIADLDCFIQLVKLRHPDVPIYLLGQSMGAAIVIATMTQSNHQLVNGIILAAPAVWARQTMPWYQNTLLWTLSHTVPWMTLTGEGIEIMPSDNIKVLQALSKDPLVIKETRIESIYGLANLMDQAYSSAGLITDNALLLYGEKDEVIPKQPTYQFLNNLANTSDSRITIALYKNGYHMLLRDLDAAILWNDIYFWINTFATPLPSGADIRAQQILNQPIE
ncbi:MAG: alpha/beta hydrolase [Gammaproteobacteria bacterium]|nr:MAG: alpha/beta hydrolase [Gammaproteobacteria bacterium]